MKWDEDDGKSDKASSSSSSNGGSSSSSGGGSGGGSIKSNTATIEYETEWTKDGKHNARILGSYSAEDRKKIKKRIGDEYKLVSSLSGETRSLTIGFDTGDYTGAWGRGGKIAMLHEKELVLNKNDTKNMLDTVGIVRQLGTSLSAIKSTLGDRLTQYTDRFNNNISGMEINKTTSQKLDQNVKIEANFPNVKNANEIETAFNNLVNLASQRAMSTRR